MLRRCRASAASGSNDTVEFKELHVQSWEKTSKLALARRALLLNAGSET